MKKFAKHAGSLLLGEKNGKEIGKGSFIAVRDVERISYIFDSKKFTFI